MGEENQQSVILWQGSPLERIVSSEPLARTSLETLHTRFYVPEDAITMGQYGIAGFLIMDTRPEKRWESYTDSELFGVSHSLEHCTHLPPEAKAGTLGASHFVNTDKGFKMVRYFLIPRNVRKFFEGDKFLGVPMIRKLCEEGTIPEWFDEEIAYEVFAQDYENHEGEKLVGRIIELISPRLRELGETEFVRYDFRHQAYLSFHPWQFYPSVIGAGENSITMVTGNFDRFIAATDRNKTLKRRDLSNEGAAEYRISLPQAH